MSNQINISYLDPEIDLATRLKDTIAEHERDVSVVVHWGIQQRQMQLQALLRDQQENLHCAMTENSCSCGLVLDSENKLTLLDLVLSEHHRNPVTLEKEPNPRFRGLVGKRLFSMTGGHKTDLSWDAFVLEKFSTHLNGELAVPLTWQLVRKEPKVSSIRELEKAIQN